MPGWGWALIGAGVFLLVAIVVIALVVGSFLVRVAPDTAGIDLARGPDQRLDADAGVTSPSDARTAGRGGTGLRRVAGRSAGSVRY